MIGGLSSRFRARACLRAALPAAALRVTTAFGLHGAKATDAGAAA